MKIILCHENVSTWRCGDLMTISSNFCLKVRRIFRRANAIAAILDFNCRGRLGRVESATKRGGGEGGGN